MKTKYKGLLIERKENTNQLIFTRIEISRKDSLNELYKILNCNIIDIQERFINNKIYDFIFDDEYLINGKTEKAENITAFGYENGQILELIYGNLFICGVADENGKETDLKESDIENIIESLTYLTNKNDNKNYQVIKYNFNVK